MISCYPLRRGYNRLAETNMLAGHLPQTISHGQDISLLYQVDERLVSSGFVIFYYIELLQLVRWHPSRIQSLTHISHISVGVLLYINLNLK